MESLVTLFKKFEIERPIVIEIDNIISKTLKDCKDKIFHSCKYKCIYDIDFTKRRKNKKVDLKLEKRRLKEKTIFARHNIFKFNQINKSMILNEGDFSDINFHYLKLKIHIMYRQLFNKMYHNEEYVKNFCSHSFNKFHNVCRRWCVYTNPLSN